MSCVHLHTLHFNHNNTLILCKCIVQLLPIAFHLWQMLIATLYSPVPLDMHIEKLWSSKSALCDTILLSKPLSRCARIIMSCIVYFTKCNEYLATQIGDLEWIGNLSLHTLRDKMVSAYLKKKQMNRRLFYSFYIICLSFEFLKNKQT